MIAGYDYLTLRWREGGFWTRTRMAACALLIAGGILVGIGGAYYGYANNARDGLPELVQAPAVEIAPVWSPNAKIVEPEPVSQPFLPETSLYSGDAGDISSYSDVDLPEGFALIDFSEDNPLLPVAAVTRMIISSLDIDSNVVELSITDLDDRRAYETPNNTIGHIPETADAGEQGSGWYFGHTESPILDEGKVFFNLQRVADELRVGNDVDIITDNGAEQFLYRVTGTRVVHEDDLTLENSESPSIHLVSCVPRLVYDHRLIVDAALVASKPGS